MVKVNVSIGILLLFTFSLLCVAQDTVAGHEIVGAPKCKGCHKSKTGDQWKIWSESAHARAFETLASEKSRKIATEKGLGDPQEEVECLKCHVTRLSLGDGVLINEKGKYSDKEGVGCESCHGAGSDYKAKKIMQDPEAARAAGLVMDNTAQLCSQCHNQESPTFKDFNFKQRWAEIVHPIPIAAEVLSNSWAVISNMPGEITFKSSVGDVLFDHKAHVKDQQVECVECHHQIHAGDLDTPHPDYMKSSWISCNICHDTESAKNGKYYKCSHCHLSNPDDIADETLSSKVVTHKSCWNCHEAGKGVEASKSCTECHAKKPE